MHARASRSVENCSRSNKKRKVSFRFLWLCCSWLDIFNVSMTDVQAITQSCHARYYFKYNLNWRGIFFTKKKAIRNTLMQYSQKHTWLWGISFRFSSNPNFNDITVVITTWLLIKFKLRIFFVWPQWK